MVDLASGSGGQWRTLIPQLRSKNDDFRLVLTDKFPNSLNPSRVKQTFPDIVTVESQPVDASCVPDHLTGVRTLFLSLHHFKPDLARGILAHAVAENTPISIFEAQQRNIEHVIRFSFSPIMVLILTPMIRPFSIGRLIFTYIIPIVPLVVLWDGVVSVLRTYTLEEIEKLAAVADVDRQFIWKTKLINHGQQKILVLTGYPKLQTADRDRTSPRGEALPPHRAYGSRTRRVGW